MYVYFISLFLFLLDSIKDYLCFNQNDDNSL